MTIKRIFEVLGVESNTTGHGEKLISAVGGFAAIFSAMWVSSHYLDPQGAVLLVASMGASAALLFAVPHGPLSQPWPLVGGHLLSAAIGVACAQTISNPLLAGPLSVALAIAGMYYLRCLHPPGGGTALVAVTGGASVHALGYQFVLTPVLLNVMVMLFAAIVWNNAFAWRRYPAYFKKRPARNGARKDTSQLSHADFEYALREIGSYIDITEQDLAKIYQLAVKHARRISTSAEPISVGNYYANGEFGAGWSVRKVIKLAEEDTAVNYLIVAGEGEGSSGTVTKMEFMAWQRYEVIPSEGSWHRIMQL